MSVERERYVALAANAHIDRKYAPVGDTVPTIGELESLASRVERLNTEGSTTEFIDAQSEYIDALTVALEWQVSGTVTTEYHDSIVGDAQRQIHALEAEIQTARAEAWDEGVYATPYRSSDIDAEVLAHNPYRASIERTEADRG